jgi:hypothetical protein
MNAEAIAVLESELCRLRRVEQYAKLVIEAHQRARRGEMTQAGARTMLRLLDDLARVLESDGLH